MPALQSQCAAWPTTVTRHPVSQGVRELVRVTPLVVSRMEGKVEMRGGRIDLEMIGPTTVTPGLRSRSSARSQTVTPAPTSQLLGLSLELTRGDAVEGVFEALIQLGLCL